MENWRESFMKMVRDLELEDRRKSEQEQKSLETCAHRFEDCDGDWMCPKCGIIDASRVCYSHCDDGETLSRTTFRRNRTPEEVKLPKPLEGEIAPTTLRELRKLGVKSGIKCASRMNSGELCRLLGTPPISTKGRSRKSATITLADQETGGILRFPSISKTAKYLGVNPASVAYRMKGDGRIEAGGRTFTVGKEEEEEPDQREKGETDQREKEETDQREEEEIDQREEEETDQREEEEIDQREEEEIDQREEEETDQREEEEIDQSEEEEETDQSEEEGETD